jgi:hypothetical protein
MSNAAAAPAKMIAAATAGGGDAIAASRPLAPATFLPHFLPEPIDASKFPRHAMAPRSAQRQVEGLRALDATPRLNLASFVTTYMEPECCELMHQAMAVNYIDTEEYPSTEKIKEMCVSMLAELWHADLAASPACGTDTVGSSGELLLLKGGQKRWGSSFTTVTNDKHKHKHNPPLNPSHTQRPCCWRAWRSSAAGRTAARPPGSTPPSPTS